jgi:uncharacterized protein
MDPVSLIAKYYLPGSLSFRILILHSESVTRKAVGIAIRLGLPGQEIEYIREAAMLHDIGIFYTTAPEIGCSGALPYICHGYKGHELLITEGLPKHALVCERHTGTGLSLRDIDRLHGLLPRRPMQPISIAEKIITYSDKFYSKDPSKLDEEMPFEAVLERINGYGEENGEIFTGWHRQFNQ